MDTQTKPPLDHGSATDAGHPADVPPDEPPLHWPSSLLLRGRQVVTIEHKGALYQLRLTRQDKLILTK